MLLNYDDIWKTFRISRSTLLQWEEKGILKKVVKLPDSGHRRYFKEDIEQALGISEG